jgi:Zn-dependent M28 family amino/carboxypeptidase
VYNLHAISCGYTLGLNSVYISVSFSLSCFLSFSFFQGSHLDSVDAGPGMNDNGSGSSANLALALMIARYSAESGTAESGTVIRNKLRFAWWSAEEVGLVGSTQYAQSYALQNRSDITCNINLDMLASPNYVRFLLNDTLAGSMAITGLFESHFDSKGLPYDYTQADGRSDYASFQ